MRFIFICRTYDGHWQPVTPACWNWSVDRQCLCQNETCACVDRRVELSSAAQIHVHRRRLNRQWRKRRVEMGRRGMAGLSVHSQSLHLGLTFLRHWSMQQTSLRTTVSAFAISRLPSLFSANIIIYCKCFVVVYHLTFQIHLYDVYNSGYFIMSVLCCSLGFLAIVVQFYITNLTSALMPIADNAVNSRNLVFLRA